MKYALILLLAVSLNGTASTLDASETPAKLDVAIAETAISNAWKVVASSTKQASKRDIEAFELRVEELGEKLDKELNSLVSQKLNALLINE